jgi:hypothetical protein
MTNSEAPEPGADHTTETAVETPGDSQQVPVPNEHAAEGTSEQTPKIDGVYTYPEVTDDEP